MQRKIFILIFVQFLSLLGTHMSNFGLSLYLYEKSHSLYLYSFFSIMIILPEAVLAPVIGHHIDRVNKKVLMMVGHGGAGLSSMAILFLLRFEYQNYYVYLLFVMIGSLFNAMVLASFHVIVGHEVGEKSMGKASSVIEFGLGMIMILSPAMGASMLDMSGIFSLFYIDVATFAFAFIVIAALPLARSLYGKNDTPTKLTSAFLENILFLKANKLLYLSLFLFALIQFNIAQVTVLITPVILSISTKTTLGIVMSFAGVGMLLASLLLFFIKINRYLYWINRFALFQALILFLAILDVGLPHIFIGSFLFMFFGSSLNIVNYAYWQKEIANEKKGQLFGIRNSIMMLSLLLGYLLSGPLVELMRIFLKNSDSLSQIIGTHLMPEIRLLFLINGLVIVSVILFVEIKRRNIVRK